jgi:hypothetical protein
VRAPRASKLRVTLKCVTSSAARDLEANSSPANLLAGRYELFAREFRALDGGDLQQSVASDHLRVCAGARDICSAPSLLHSRGIAQRDISPRNVRWSANGAAKLIRLYALAGALLSKLGRLAAEFVREDPPLLAAAAVALGDSAESAGRGAARCDLAGRFRRLTC